MDSRLEWEASFVGRWKKERSEEVWATTEKKWGEKKKGAGGVTVYDRF